MTVAVRSTYGCRSIRRPRVMFDHMHNVECRRRANGLVTTFDYITGDGQWRRYRILTSVRHRRSMWFVFGRIDG